jgi:hypothetical protein
MEYGECVLLNQEFKNLTKTCCNESGYPCYPKEKLCDDNFMKFVGWSESNECIKKYFSPAIIQTISKKVTQLLEGVDSCSRSIVVPNKTICAVMSQVYQGFRPPTGDIYGRLNVPNDETTNYVQNMIDQTVEIIVSDVRNNLGMDEVNSKLNIWHATILGDFNVNGLRAHDVIKTRKRRPNNMGCVSFSSY